MNYHQTKKCLHFFSIVFTLSRILMFITMNKHLAFIHCVEKCFILSNVDVHNPYLQVGRDRLIEGSRGILQVRYYYHFFSRPICKFLFTLTLGAINHVSRKFIMEYH